MTDVRIRKVKMLRGLAMLEADKMGLKPDDLVVVRTSIEKVEGDAVSYLLKPKEIKCPQCGFKHIVGSSRFKCGARQLPQYKVLGDGFCVYYIEGDCVKPEQDRCKYRVKKDDD